MSAQTLTPWLKLHPWVTETRHVHPEVAMAFRVGYGVFRTPVNDTWVQSHRIVLPHFWRGDLVGWQTRRLTEDGTPKYLSSADFPKDLTIFNYQPRQSVVLVESMSGAHEAPPGPAHRGHLRSQDHRPPARTAGRPLLRHAVVRQRQGGVERHLPRRPAA